MMSLRDALQLYLVADPEACPRDGDISEIIQLAIDGGVTMVQLRNKVWTDDVVRILGPIMVDMCHQAGIRFIMNDRLDLALEIDADGVHLGVNDMPIEDARAMARRAGRRNFIIGYSPESDDDLRSARKRGADYLGIGPVFGTRSKADAGEALGLVELKRRFELGQLPAVGIGGISESNYRSVLETGIDGIAVISAIMGASDPEAAALQLSTN